MPPPLRAILRPCSTASAEPVPVKHHAPRTARLLALAHKQEKMVRRGEVKDYAEIARRMGLSRARVTQICCLTLLDPQVQERLLFDETFFVPMHAIRPAAQEAS